MTEHNQYIGTATQLRCSMDRPLLLNPTNAHILLNRCTTSIITLSGSPERSVVTDSRIGRIRGRKQPSTPFLTSNIQDLQEAAVKSHSHLLIFLGKRKNKNKNKQTNKQKQKKKTKNKIKNKIKKQTQSTKTPLCYSFDVVFRTRGHLCFLNRDRFYFHNKRAINMHFVTIKR